MGDGGGVLCSSTSGGQLANGQTLLAALSANGPTFILGGAAPDSGVLIGTKGKFKTGVAAGTAEADIFCGGDLFHGDAGTPNGEEQSRVGVTTASSVSPVGVVVECVSG